MEDIENAMAIRNLGNLHVPWPYDGRIRLRRGCTARVHGTAMHALY